MERLNRHARVEGGYASVRSVASMEKEDHMHSFFLAETCKYLFLLANDTFWKVCARSFFLHGVAVINFHQLHAFCQNEIARNSMNGMHLDEM